MQLWLRLPCSRCGEESVFGLQHAGQRVCCRGCQGTIDVPPLGKLVTLRPRKAAHQTTDSCLLIWVIGAAAALILPPATWWLVRKQQRASAAERANRAVAAQ